MPFLKCYGAQFVNSLVASLQLTITCCTCVVVDRVFNRVVDQVVDQVSDKVIDPLLTAVDQLIIDSLLTAVDHLFNFVMQVMPVHSMLFDNTLYIVENFLVLMKLNVFLTDFSHIFVLCTLWLQMHSIEISMPVFT